MRSRITIVDGSGEGTGDVGSMGSMGSVHVLLRADGGGECAHVVVHQKSVGKHAAALLLLK